jgi:hypothetical protein
VSEGGVVYPWRTPELRNAFAWATASIHAKAQFGAETKGMRARGIDATATGARTLPVRPQTKITLSLNVTHASASTVSALGVTDVVCPEASTMVAGGGVRERRTLLGKVSVALDLPELRRDR